MDKENITEVGKDSEKGNYSVWEASVDEDVQTFSASGVIITLYSTEGELT